jgi:tetratricopeptide (TPR) repeat protein
MFHAKNSIEIDPVRPDARRLLAILLYDGGDFEGVAALMREAISRDRKDATSWFTLGLAQFALGKTAEAIYSLSTASGLVPDDEVMRIALENLVMDSSAFEASQREPYAEWHIAKGFELEQRSYFDQSLIEYRRALRIYPYSVRGRTLYAELLRKRGLPAKQLSELRFLESIGKANRSTLDSIEIYASLLADGVGLSWGLDQYALTKRPYSVAIFIQPGQLEEYHTGGAGTLVRYLTDILASSSRLQVLPLDPRIGGPSEAFKRAREADADYYLTLTLRETDREIELGGELRVGRTGSVATTFRSYRTGNDRVKNTVVRLADSLVSSLQPEGSILKRSQDGALIDMGASDGLKAGDKLLVLKKGSLGVKNEGMGPSYAVSSIVGTLTVQQLDEEVCSGLLKSSGFFDTINSGDEVIAAPAEVASTSGGQSTAPAAKNPGGQPKPVSEPNFPGLFVSIRGLR